ncbi:uncharacterized protein N7529_010646 [Penicillium soppii]|uniref:uncharacterized protein n=1 Tax=Penicillium soppii TaxID=69789 RepID=UPI0025479E99|nr:uncharacterized protein N7529_010646 [Penicillium soppii]KAJ5851261.1 hypothetical protein N7529_010646 [Penicillium soppii]
MCKHCLTILEHPYTIKKDIHRKEGRYGTTTIIRHLKTSTYQKASARASPSEPKIPSTDTFRRQLRSQVYREVLLDFKPLYGAYTSANISTILLQTLVDHDIQDRIFGLTADNTLNNRTLVDSLQQALPPNVNIIRTPCLAHVIQLSLKQLLDCLKAAPLNDTTKTKWTKS